MKNGRVSSGRQCDDAEERPADSGRPHGGREAAPPTDASDGCLVHDGTRIPAALILGYLAAGHDTVTIKREFPHLTADDVAACLDYARELAEFETTPA